MTRAGGRSAASAAAKPELPVRLFRNAAAWEKWLERNADQSPGLWLRLARKAAPLASVTYDEAVEIALCHGWIDGQRKPFDDQSWIQRFTPRGPKSAWSKINRNKAEALIAQGRMGRHGHVVIERARADGRWDRAYDSHRTATAPPDLLAALAKRPKAAAFFATLDRTNRYAVLYRIQTAPPSTRARRIADFVAMLARGEKLHDIGAVRRKAAGRRRAR